MKAVSINGTITFLLIIFYALGAHSKSSLNSLCYVQNKSKTTIEGSRTDELFEVASVSKVFTSYWAIHQLGPYYRFKTVIYITPVGQQLYDVHVKGSRDPFWGRHLSHFLFAELNKVGVKEIRKLSFDENFTMRWKVLSDFLETMNPTPDEIGSSLERHINNIANEYPSSRREAERIGVTLPAMIRLKASEVRYLPSPLFKPEKNTYAYILQSAPLYRYLKEVNRVSNNHVADKVYEILGGRAQFEKFMQKNLQLNSSNIQFINGSGNSVVVGTDTNGRSIKEYNKASCGTIIRVLLALNEELAKTKKLQLKDVMAVSRSDDSTLMPRYASIPNSLIAKTGTVDPAITLAGMISTAHGDVYFGVLYSTDGAGDWNTARNHIRDEVFDLIEKFGGKNPFSYSSSAFLPFDKNSGFVHMSLPSNSLP